MASFHFMYVLESYKLTFIMKHFFPTAEDSEKREEMLAKFQDFQRKADMYYAYHSIQRYTVSGPFHTNLQ